MRSHDDSRRQNLGFRVMNVRRKGVRARIVLGTGFLSEYTEGGGHWTWFLQYPLGLRALGHDVFVLDVLRSTGERSSDERRVKRFFQRLGRFGLRDHAAVLLHTTGANDRPALELDVLYGSDESRVLRIARSADLLWNLCGSLGPPLRRLFVGACSSIPILASISSRPCSGTWASTITRSC